MNKASPLKQSAAMQISPEKRSRENVCTDDYQSPPRQRKLGSPSKLKGSPQSGKRKISGGVAFGKPIEIIRSK